MGVVIPGKLRSTMTEEWQTNLALLSIERELSASIDKETVIDRFTAVDQLIKGVNCALIN